MGLEALIFSTPFFIHIMLVFHPPRCGSQISFSSTPLGWFFIHPILGPKSVFHPVFHPHLLVGFSSTLMWVEHVFQRQCGGLVVGSRPGIEERLG